MRNGHDDELRYARHRLDSERLSTGEIVVWLKPEAKVEQTATAGVPEEFLRGEFQGGVGQVARIAAAIRPMLALAAPDEKGCFDSLGCPCSGFCSQGKVPCPKTEKG